MKTFFRVLGKVVTSIASGCTYFVLSAFIQVLITSPETLTISSSAFMSTLLVSILMGFGFNMPTLVYHSQTMPTWKKLSIHFTLSMLVFFPCMIFMGWLPQGKGILPILVFILIALAIFFIIWGAFYVYFYLLYRTEAKAINKKLNN